MYKKILVLVITLFLSFTLKAQFTDDFSDGDFTNNPTWSGETSLYQISTSFELQSNGPSASDTLHLYTPNTQIDNTEWQFWVNLPFSPSTSNYARVYLVSNQSNLGGALNGYYVQIGGETGSDDSIDLFKQSGTTHTKIIDGINGHAGKSTNTLRIKVLRDNLGNWELYADTLGGTNFLLEGNTLDNTFNSTAFFGTWVKHTSSRKDMFYFDDFYLGNIIIDTTPPEISSISVISQTEIDVLFSESVTSASAQNTSNYSTNNGIGNPNSAIVDGSNPALVHLTYGTNFTDGIQNQLIVNNIMDNSSNTAPDTGYFTFFATSIADSFDILINEIFADPSPQIGLPDAEYVELYNRSSKSFDLANWTFSDASGSSTLNSYLLAAGSYVILCNNSDTAKFSAFSNVLGVSSFPSLNNSSDNLTLKNELGNWIHNVNYSSTWYQDNVKDDGGWSLERIDTSNICSDDMNNWIASTNSSGGTPGQLNSVNGSVVDLVAPNVTQVSIQSLTQITITFNETLDSAQATNTAFYSMDNSIGNPTNALPIAPFDQVQLTFATAMDSNIIYNLTVNGLTDCSGNTSNSSIQVAIPHTAQVYDVVINEIFPDPEPSVALIAEEFVEIYNRSSYAINLQNWTLTDGSSTATLSDYLILPGQYLILCSTSNESNFGLYGSALGVSSFPSLNNTGELLQLKNASSQVIHQIDYTDEWYGDESKADGGWTLELSDTTNPCGGSDIWRASNDPNGGTPGKVNSIAGLYTDQTAPIINSVEIINALEIRVNFSEAVESTTGLDVNNYNITPSLGTPLMANFYGTGDKSVSLVLSTAMDTNVSYTLSVNNVGDCTGNVKSQSFKFAIGVDADPSDLVINEMMFYPISGSQRYLELYNRSNKIINLKNWLLARDYDLTDSLYSYEFISETDLFIFPGDYLALTEDVNDVQSIYKPISEAKIVKIKDIPSFPDNEGRCVVMKSDSTIIDQVWYTDDWQLQNLISLRGVALERINPEQISQSVDNWASGASTVNYGTPGYKNSQFSDVNLIEQNVTLENQSFSPDGDGYKDVLILKYKFTDPNTIANVTIWDKNGNLVKRLQENFVLPTEEGFLKWDGLRDDNTKAKLGIYVILFESINPKSGESKKSKLSCVLATKLK